MDRLLIGIKFCGGCREQYDRKGASRSIKDALSYEQIDFVEAEKGGSYDTLLVICGCPVKCADLSGYNAGKIIAVDGLNRCQQAQKELIDLIKEE